MYGRGSLGFWKGWLSWKQGHFLHGVARGMGNTSMCRFFVVDAFVRSWVASKLRRCWFPGGFSLNPFCIISKPLMHATIWIKHLENAMLQVLGLQVLESSIEIGLRWYKKWTNNKWTYVLTDHLMLDLESIIALAFVIYIVDFVAHDLHPADEKCQLY